MKQIIIVAICVFLLSPAFAQKAGKKKIKSTHHKVDEGKKPAIMGVVRNAQNEPMADVEAMVYKLDTIVASGFTNAKGNYVTSAVPPGIYVVKIIYPNSDKFLSITGVKVEKEKIVLDINADAPLTADSIVSYANFTKKKEVKKPGKH